MDLPPKPTGPALKWGRPVAGPARPSDVPDLKSSHSHSTLFPNDGVAEKSEKGARAGAFLAPGRFLAAAARPSLDIDQPVDLVFTL